MLDRKATPPLRRVVVTAAALASSLCAPAVSVGSVTIGSDQSGAATANHNCNTTPGTIIQTTLPGRQVTAPFDGLIVRWRVKNYGPIQVTLRVVRPVSTSGSTATFSFLGSSATQTVGSSGVVTFAESPPLPVAVGDSIGVSGSNCNGILGQTSVSGAADAAFAGAPADGAMADSAFFGVDNIDWLYNADVVGRPTSTAVAPACPGGSRATVTVTADPDPATGAKAAHFVIDGGAEQVAATIGDPGVATVSVPGGVHSLEFWGEDQLRQQEATHHTITAGCPAAPPSLLRPSPSPPSPPVASLAPTVANVTQSHANWREGDGLPSFARTHGAPLGTTFTFTLNEQARVSLVFTQQVDGRKVNGNCVARTNRYRKKPACKRTVTRGTLSFTGHSANNKVSFQGRVSASNKFKPGRYKVVITATNSAGEHSKPQALTFTIVN